MCKNIKFFIVNIIRIILAFLVSVVTIRNNKIIIMGLRTPITKLNRSQKDYFMHNTKVVLLKSLKTQINFKIIYLCDNNLMINKFNNIGINNVYKRYSLKGLYYTLTAKYCFYDDTKCGLTNPILLSGATCINLWHGISWKKFGYEATNKIEELPTYLKKIFYLLCDKEKYVIANNPLEVNCYHTAFLAKPENAPILGSPRYDMFFEDIEHIDLFMEEDFQNIKHFKEQGKKLFLYMPTFRDTGKDISDWLKTDELKEFLQENNAILICKLHFADKNSLDFPLESCFYKMDKNSDAYPIFKYTDAMISDYSSAIIDYILVDKPAIYYVPDLEEYQEQCREFYVPYDEWVTGEKAFNLEELLVAMKNAIENPLKNSNKRKGFRDKFFQYQDGKSCERVLEWIKTLK